MKPLSILLALSLCGGAWAGGSGEHGHDAHAHGDHGAEMAVGHPGDPDEVDRVIAIRMVETEAGMGFEPASLAVGEGETIRFEVTNDGALEHEIVFDTEQANLDHQARMAQMPDMAHDDPNALRLEPGESGTLVWTFDNAGAFQFACLIPGHLEAGMHGAITVG